MTRATKSRFGIVAILLAGVGLGYVVAEMNSPSFSSADASEAKPKQAVAPRQATPAPVKRPDAWYPRTETLGSDEMFVVALGTAAFVDGLKKAYAWDVRGRSGTLPDAGGRLIAHEFDYKKVGGVVYQQNGVTITSFPAIHSLDGSVSYRLDWNGLSFVFGGDSAPNKWFIEQSNGADFVIHECFYTAEGLASYLGFPPRQAVQVSSYIHTPPAAFGKIMSEVKPRLAVGYHSILVPEMLQDITDNVRTTYDGPLVIASDLMCWNITKDSIQQREVMAAERVQPPPTSPEYMKAKRSGEAEMSDYILGGKWKGYTPPPLPEQ